MKETDTTWMVELNWPLWPDLIKFHTIGDGNCFFHAILHAVYDTYKEADVFERIKLTRNFRDSLIPFLKQRYHSLSMGHLEEFSRGFPEYSLEALSALLKSNFAVDNIFVELISDYLHIDIFLLDSEKKSLYVTGSDTDHLFQNRKSIILLVSPGHYELVGLKINNENTPKTFFEPNHPLIEKLKQRTT